MGWQLGNARTWGFRSSRRRSPIIASGSQATNHLRLEPLEPRRILAADLLITEVVSSNELSLEDEEGDATDWIEIYNASDAPADLSGWHLSDDQETPDKWTFPSVTVDANDFLVVFASGKNRVDVDSPLHTNFRLNRDGEYLALTQQDGTTAFEIAPTIPELQTDRSYGIPQEANNEALVEESSETRVFVPLEDNGGPELGNTWIDPAFDDSSWQMAPGAVGFEGGRGTYGELVNNDLLKTMFRKNSSAYIRIPFVVQDLGSIFALTLRMKFDDGYIAYLNGQEIAQRNAAAVPSWDSKSATSNRDTAAVIFEDVDVTETLSLLREGENVLAIHGMNTSRLGDDFLIGAELLASRPDVIEDRSMRFFAHPTPGRANGALSYAGLVTPVTTSVERGFYEQAFDVVLESTTPGATLVYTTDGSDPSLDNGTQVVPTDTASPVSTTLNISTTTTLRANAFLADFLSPATNTQTYLMLNDVVTQSFQQTVDAGFPEMWSNHHHADYGMDPDVAGPNDLFEGRFANQMIDSLTAAPTLSIVMDLDDLFGERGIHRYTTKSGREWERETSLEIIDPTTGTTYQTNAGIRIAGDNVRSFDNSLKQSMRLEFRADYGSPRLRFPIFGDQAGDSFDELVLRGGYNDSWVHTPWSTQYIRDHWARTTLLDMGRPNSHGRWVQVYINGYYWGLYNAVERPNADFSATYFGGETDEWDALNTGQVRDGTGRSWADTRTVASDVNDEDQAIADAAYLRLQGKNPDGTDNPMFETMIDLGNYIDYLITNHYGGNTDWPHRNWYAGTRRGVESTGYKFYAWDTEKILDHGEGSHLNTNQTGSRTGVAVMYRPLREHEDFQLLYADHIHRHFFNGGALYVNPENPAWNPDTPENNVPAARYHALAETVETPLIAESARWGDTQSRSVRNDGQLYTVDNWRSVRDNLYTNYFPQRSAIVLEQYIAAGLYPTVAAPVFSQHGGTVANGFELTMNAPGDVYYTIDGTDPRQSRLEPGVDVTGISPNAIQYTTGVTLNANTVIKARTLIDGEWSALNEASFLVGHSFPLRISEIMYHPRAPENGGDDDDYEFVELLNISEVDRVPLKDVAFDDGIRFTFPDVELAPGERIVVVRDLTAFQQRYGTEIRVAGQYGGSPESPRLSNGGESLRLVDASGDVIQEFTYDDAWYPSTDGAGFSLTVINPQADLGTWEQAVAWRASATIDGSPGSSDVRADLNGDGLTDARDIDFFCAGYRNQDMAFDLTGNGSLDDDLAFVVEQLFGTNMGDANLDGRFDSEDLVAVLQAGEYDDGISGNSTWAEGDWNCDGDFDSEDIVHAFRAGGYVVPTAKPSMRSVAAARDAGDE